MSGAADKARFYLEQAVPQLQEFKEKKIFSEDEIRSLVTKRSSFEHKVLARGSTPVDFARYAAWEIGLENLRHKRCKRMKIKGSTSHTGQARIFKIFDRGTQKHPGDVALWMSYLEYCKQAKATKKFKTVLTAAIRLHPLKAELWLYAARWSLEAEADMKEARSFMSRGARFCTMSKDLWIEWAKLEMIYLAKIAMRRRILGIDEEENAVDAMEVEGAGNESAFGSEDVVAIPDFKMNVMRPSMLEGVKVDTEASQDPMNTPALQGAIPLAIFDEAKKQQFFNASVAADFFDMFAIFTQVRCLPKILQHVLDVLADSYPVDPSTCDCYNKQPLVGIDPTSPEFPVALGIFLDRLNETMEKTKDKSALAKKTKAWVEPILLIGELDPAIKTVLQHTMRKL
ncbi:related to UTP6-U3 snoRNP protein [Rhynchosporium agropyri]|uniref:Related to UTP6-U3 snoRNP protein n=1 Tax=Rhynchosporium agropyri TaxID=914238 RepID=A0A1E1KIU8_9HELO|nr:related to UTP6-U3 snoRNP protein [Rhynchosporium agropyri]